MPKLKDKSTKYRILLALLEGDKRFSDLLRDIMFDPDHLNMGPERLSCVK